MSNKMIRTVILGESPAMPSGFGQQNRILVEGLTKLGHEIFVVCIPSPAHKEPLNGYKEWKVQRLDDIQSVDRILTRIKPDAVIVFWFTMMGFKLMEMRSATANCPVFVWLPWEASTLPPKAKEFLEGVPPNRVVHLSEYAKELWSSATKTNLVIPHAVDSEIFKPLKDTKKELRRKWSERLRFPLFEDAVVILNVDRNIWHKRWDATFDFVAKLQKKLKNKTVQLIAHCKIREDGPPPGFDLEAAESKYKIKGKVCYTEFSWMNSLTRAELNELYNLCDLRITTSQGEGFGIPTVECMAAECAQIVNNHTTMPELLGKDCPFLVDPGMTEEKLENLWQVPNVNAMVDRAAELLRVNNSHAGYLASLRQRAKDNFNKDSVCQKWDSVIRNEVSKKRDYWFDQRWGYASQTRTYAILRGLATVVHKVCSFEKVLEIGSFNGKFIDECLELGMDITGIEPDSKSLERASERSSIHIKNSKFKDNWPQASVVVMTDMFDLVGNKEDVQSLLNKACTYQWVILRANSVYRWDTEVLDKEWIPGYMETRAMNRRYDLERVVRDQFFEDFDHEIWQQGNDTSVIPPALAVEAEV